MAFHSGAHATQQEGKESAEAGRHRWADVEDGCEDRTKSHRGKSAGHPHTPSVPKHQDTGIYSTCVSEHLRAMTPCRSAQGDPVHVAEPNVHRLQPKFYVPGFPTERRLMGS